MKITRALPMTLLAAALLVGTGCATPDNDRLTLGTTKDPVVVFPALEPGPALEPATAPSLVTLDRSSWERIDFIVPDDATEHYPHFTRLQPRFDHGTARARGEYPTALTAFEQEGDFGPIYAESWVWPAYVAGDVVMIIPRALAPAQLSPMTHEQRAPEWIERTVPSDDEAQATPID